MSIHFFLPMVPPTVTHQEHKVTVRKGKPVFYDTPELKKARSYYMAALGKYVPKEPLTGPIRLVTKWIWPHDKNYVIWKATKPDTDNLIKLLKDCMTAVGFWEDDAQVASEITEKFLGTMPGIWVCIQELQELQDYRKEN